MLEAFIITLREGIEAFLIVAITLAYLRKTGRGSLSTAVYSGTGAAVVISIATAVLLREVAVTPLYEGILAAVAAVLVASMLFYMARAARHLGTEIGLKVENAAQRPGVATFMAVAGFTLLMITREGMETAFMIASLMSQTNTFAMTIGAFIGLAAAAILAWGWSRYGHKINLKRFFQVTTIFLGMFAAQLVIYAFHELTEAGVLPLDNEYWHMASEPYGPDGSYGLWISYSLVLMPMAWLFYTIVRDRMARNTGQLVRAEVAVSAR